MKLIILRHGETIENDSNIAQGQLPGHLSEDGKLQIKEISEELQKEKIDLIFSSDLGRTRETVKIITKYLPKLRVRLSKKIRERNFGNFQGKPYPKDWDSLVWVNGFLKKNDGESNLEIFNRIKKFLKKMVSKYPEKTILIITHKRVIQTILAIKNDIPVEEMHKMKIPKNAEIIKLEINNNIF